MSSAGRLETIWIKRAKRGPMDPVPSARAHTGRGLESNADQGGKRQVTLVSVESWADAVAAVEGKPDPILRRANLLVRGVDLVESRGKTLGVGDVKIRIHGETRPCRRMEESHPGLQNALDPEWRAGAYGEVLTDGEINLGDEVRWVDFSTD
ncbi:MAG: MOSC domain-containing protein [bacterium]|nr:MOSC domain-containing protein [bacterium]